MGGGLACKTVRKRERWETGRRTEANSNVAGKRRKGRKKKKVGTIVLRGGSKSAGGGKHVKCVHISESAGKWESVDKGGVTRVQ